MSEIDPKAIEELIKSVKRIETAVLGDEEAQIPGIAKRVVVLEEYKETDKKLKNKVAGAVIVGTPILVLLWDAFKDWFKSFIHVTN